MINYRTKKVLIWILSVLVVVGVVYLLIWLQKTSPVKSLKNEGEKIVVPEVEERDWVLGDPDKASLLLIEYGDFQCPACSYYAPLVKKLFLDFKGKIAVVYRHFPLSKIHGNAVISALAAEAVGKQDKNKFWEMYDLLYKNQNDWASKSREEAIEVFLNYANSLNIDAEKFKKDLENDDLLRKMELKYEEGVKMGLSYTPTFILNGKLIQNPKNYDQFKEIIEKNISSSGTK